MSLLLVESAVVSGPRAGVAGGMGVATIDFLFAAVAVVIGGAAGAALAGHETEIHLVAAAVLAAIAAPWPARPLARAHAGRAGAHVITVAPGAHFARFFAITAANPLTIASFAAIAAALTFDSVTSAAAFAAGWAWPPRAGISSSRSPRATPGSG